MQASSLIQELVPKVSPAFVSDLAIKARSAYKLRHVPLLLAKELAAEGKLKANTLKQILQRPDELGEFLALYWANGRSPISNQVKKGLASAFHKFNEYQFAKWDKNKAKISVRDVMFLTHPRPISKDQEQLFNRIAADTLQTPDTWEVLLSSGKDKAEVFTSLMQENKLGALAFLRNLRNMVKAGVSDQLIREYANRVDVTRVLPFRYISAAKIVPQFEDMLEQMMFKSLETHPKLPGKTLLLVDVSGSMFFGNVSNTSDLSRFDAAAALAMLCREVCEQVEIYSFSTEIKRVAPRRGFALRDAVLNSQGHGGTYLGAALETLKGTDANRVIVFTDEQTHDPVNAPPKQTKGYIINVAAYENGVNHSRWTTITGFSEAVMDYIQAIESEERNPLI